MFGFSFGYQLQLNLSVVCDHQPFSRFLADPGAGAGAGVGFEVRMQKPTIFSDPGAGIGALAPAAARGPRRPEGVHGRLGGVPRGCHPRRRAPAADQALSSENKSTNFFDLNVSYSYHSVPPHFLIKYCMIVIFPLGVQARPLFKVDPISPGWLGGCPFFGPFFCVIFF